MPLSEIKAIKATGDTSITILFKTLHDYKLQAESPSQQAMLLGILQMASHKDHVPKMDDRFFPPYSTKKGYVEKKGKSGDWQRRWIMLGGGQLLIFRAMDCTKLVNAIPICHAQPHAVLVDETCGCWTIKTCAPPSTVR